MIDLTTQLIPLIEKEPIVSTFDSRTIISDPNEVITSYDRHNTTYVELDLLRDLEQRFIDKIIKSQTPKVCLVARYGYGKTTAAIGLWQACRKAHILAVPPAGYTSMPDIATTVYSWARTVLYENTNALKKLDELQATYLQSSTEKLAKLVSTRSGRPYEQVIGVLTDPALDGVLNLDPPTTNIVLFLEALTHIVTSNGFAGVAVFVDEFQQLLGKANAEVLTALRSLIWGLRTRKIPLGLAITMDPNSEQILGERAGDILHRIKDDDLYLDFRQIHGSDFPKQLWERYAVQLGLGGLTFRIVDKPTLVALGQICERADLSNGPRTVANVFRRIASHYAATECTYTPLQLIDDFLTGDIIFDGDANTIASIVTEFAGYAYFKRTNTHLAVLKLLAAFPSGCPIEIVERYGLLEIFNEITSELRGDIVTLLPNGYALIDLQKVGKPLNKLSLILKKYWMQITHADEDLEESIRRFATNVLPLLFPKGTDQNESWVSESELTFNVNNTYIQTFAGRLHTRHPLRRIRVFVSAEEPHLNQENGNVDINLIFVIQKNPSEKQKAFIRHDNCLVFYLNIGRIPEEGLPPDLRLVEHNLSPQPSTPSVLLNVIEFVEREITFTPLKQSEMTQVYYTLENMRRWLLNFTFDEGLLGSIDPEAATPGYRGVRDLVFRECERRFPHYNTLITSHIWRENLSLYRKVLAERTLAERRGIEAVNGQKGEIAALFGQRNHAGFDSKMRVQYPFLLDIVWSGEQGTLRFTPHPIETQVLTVLGTEGRPYFDLIEICRAEGYAREEIEEVFTLLTVRGQVKEDAGRIYKIEAMSIEELRRLGTELATELTAFEEVLPREVLLEKIEVARSLSVIELDDDSDPQREHIQLVSLSESMAKLRTRARLALLDLLDHQRDELTMLLKGLDRSIPVFTASVSFKNHLEGVRKLLEENKASLQRIGVRLREFIQASRKRAVRLDDSEIGAFLAEYAGKLRQQKETLHDLHSRIDLYQRKIERFMQWITLGENFVRLRYNITNLVQLQGTGSVSTQLERMLDEFENDVRESLAHQGLVTLEHIDVMRLRLDTVAKEYDRSLVEREIAFEQKKSTLEALIALITENKKPLKGKYQISKHDESYEDLFLEVLQVVRAVVGAQIRRVQLLDARAQGADRTQVEGISAKVDLRVIKLLARKVEEAQRKLLDEQEITVAFRHSIFEEFCENVMKLKILLDEVETKFPIQDPLPIGAEILLTKLNSTTQNLSALIDIQNALSDLPRECELAVLLQLYLADDITIEVQRKLNNI